MMLGSSYLALLFTSSVLSIASASESRGCKCLYGEACWPSESEFQQLASQLSQPIISPTPPESACYPSSSPSGNCSDVQANLRKGLWRADQAGAYQNVNFETYIFPNETVSACYLNTTIGAPCEQGNVPPIGVDARSVEDIQAAVRFASEHDLRLVVKNTGHDYLGRSAGRNGFMIWTHHLKNITYDASFLPEGASANETYKALTLGAGVQWFEAYNAAQQNQRIIVGGISTDGSVGAAGGWIGGGGHSALAPKYGLGADNAIQFTVVTANGEHVVANANTNPDLWWALRGGGPGTYGVVTSVTYKTHDITPIVSVIITANFTTPQSAKEVAVELFKLQPKISDNGWGGYGYISEGTFVYEIFATNATMEEAQSSFGPFIQFVNNTAGQNNTAALFIPAPDFYFLLGNLKDAPDSTPGGSSIGINVELASRLYTRKLLEDQPERAAEVLVSLPLGIAFNHVAGGAVAKTDPESAGLNPAWRNAIAMYFHAVTWSEGATGAEIQAQRDELKRRVAILEELEPGTGSYVNEGTLWETNPRETYFGSHYDRLLSIKDKYDPKSLFLVSSGVGSDRWDQDLTCFRN